jgi:hypothetical protein
MPNVCGIADGGADACSPKTCAQLGAQCGTADDGCGKMIDCGTCPSGLTCGGGGTPNVCGGGCGCCPLTCADQGYNCDVHGDGCGNTIDCGSCTAPETCGGSGMPGVCGMADAGADSCAPKTCAQLGYYCGGLKGDGCGNTIDCGACPAGLTCGGGGMANVCGP